MSDVAPVLRRVERKDVFHALGRGLTVRLNYTYDANDHLTSVTNDLTGRRMVYTSDAEGHVTRVQTAIGQAGLENDRARVVIHCVATCGGVQKSGLSN